MKYRLMWLLTILFWGISVWYGRRILVQEDLLSLHLTGSDDGITRPELEQILEKYYVAAYVEKGLITATVPETGRHAQLSGILTAGSHSLITGCRLWDGSFSLGASEECMISRAAALKLFGNEESAGLIVYAEGQEWLVRGVIDFAKPVILLPADKETRLPNLEFQFSGSGDNTAEAWQACYQYGITGRQKIINYSLFGAIARLFMWLPFLTMLYRLRNMKRKYQAAANKKAVCCSLELLFWCGVLLFLFQGIHFPAGFIPVKWSDFPFWITKWKETLGFTEILFTSTFMKDGVLRTGLTACGMSAAAASGFLCKATSDVPAWLYRH